MLEANISFLLFLILKALLYTSNCCLIYQSYKIFFWFGICKLKPKERLIKMNEKSHNMELDPEMLKLETR